ncbi:MAG: tetratricopeptide repeat protein [Methylococcus sp.]|nr:tetratricopeptide repeat protein [Methylococcus sp.]
MRFTEDLRINQAATLIESGRFDEAMRLIQAVLDCAPGDAEALHLAGFIAHSQGEHHRAIDLINQAIAHKPDKALFYFNLGYALLAIEDKERGVEILRKGLALDSKHPTPWTNLGLALIELKRFPEAVGTLEHVLTIEPEADVDVALASALVSAGEEGNKPSLIQQAISLLQSKPRDGQDSFAAGVILARAFEQQNRICDAIEQHQNLLENHPEHVGIRNNLARCLVHAGRANEARVHYRKCVEIEPNNFHAYSALLSGLNYEPTLTAEVHEAEIRRWEYRLAMPLYPENPQYGNVLDKDRALRIGYLSPDLRQHVVGHMFLPILKHTDRSQLLVFCYHVGKHVDELSKQIAARSDGWRHLHNASDEEIAEIIRQDKIDILVDLSGHTAHTRPLVFARKPAPIQVSWLGYFDTTGLATMDWFITDPYSSPSHSDQFFSEKLYRLPHTRLCYQPYQDMPDIDDLPAKRNGYITFGCLNNLSKLNNEVLETWSRLLDAVPSSRLLIQTMALRDKSNLARFRDICTEHSIDSSRLDLRPAASVKNFAVTYQEIDIALDPFPYCGGVTSFDALWMGVPVITLEQPRLAGRQTLSMLTNIDLPDLIAKTKTEYISLANTISQDLTQLEQWRFELRDRFRSSPLANHKEFANELERAYRFFWTSWCESNP